MPSQSRRPRSEGKNSSTETGTPRPTQTPRSNSDVKDSMEVAPEESSSLLGEEQDSVEEMHGEPKSEAVAERWEAGSSAIQGLIDGMSDDPMTADDLQVLLDDIKLQFGFRILKTDPKGTITAEMNPGGTFTAPVIPPEVQQVQTGFQETKKVGTLLGKAGQKGLKCIQKAKKAQKTKDGTYKRWEKDENGDVVKNKYQHGIKQELSHVHGEKGLWSGLGAIGGLGKAGSGLAGASYMPVNDVAAPWGAVNKMYGGGVKTAKGITKSVKSGQSKTKAREKQLEAEGRGDLLSKGLQNTKRNAGQAMNDGIVDSFQGALKTTSGALSMAQFVDPTGGTAIASTVVGTANKAMKFGVLGYRSGRDGKNTEKTVEMRKKAESGDLDAMEWLIMNDPRAASAQLLLHVQDEYYTDEEREFAKQAANEILRISEENQDGVDDAYLGDFDKLYSDRTGAKTSTGQGAKQAAVYKKIKPWLRRFDRVKKKVAGKKKPALEAKDPDWIKDQMEKIEKARDEQERMELAGEDQRAIDDMWDSAGIDDSVRPKDTHPVFREYQRIRDFRAKKTLSEARDKADQESLHMTDHHFKANSSGTGMDEVEDTLQSSRRKNGSNRKNKTIEKKKRIARRGHLTTLKTGDVDDDVKRDMARIIEDERSGKRKRVHRAKAIGNEKVST